MLSPCGCDCTECKDYKKSCDGCRQIKGKVYWAPFVNAAVCPIFHCSVNEKKLKHCGECGELPCRLYYEMQDPSMSKEEHEAGILLRAEKLKHL